MCLTAFSRILDTRKRTVNNYLNQFRASETATPYKAKKREQQGQQTERTRIAHEDIQNLATTETHYTKSKQTGMRYLPHKTKIKDLYKAYLKN